MENFTPISATIGGAMIGLSAVWLMGSVGRIAGISGILGGSVKAQSGDRLWRWTFLGGLLLAPIIVGVFMPSALEINFPITGPLLILAAVLVGFGTQLGNGCTSGHGVCGNARLSMRSFLATLVFMITGMLTVYIMRHLGGA